MVLPIELEGDSLRSTPANSEAARRAKSRSSESIEGFSSPRQHPFGLDVHKVDIRQMSDTRTICAIL
jgi:hypothetical protein